MVRHITYIGTGAGLTGFIHERHLIALKSKEYRDNLSAPLPNVDVREAEDMRVQIERDWNDSMEYQHLVTA